MTQEPSINYQVLRLLFRHLQAFEALFETEGIDVITAPDGEAFHLADIQRLYGLRSVLSQRQRQAIELFLFHDMRERDVAAIMGVSPVNPVAIYATQGLRRLAAIYESGFETDGGDYATTEAVQPDAAQVRGLGRGGRRGYGADKAVA